MFKCKSSSRRSKGGNNMFTVFSSENIKFSNGIMFAGVKSKENYENCKSKTIDNLARIGG